MIGIIGGSGLSGFDGLVDPEWRAVDTPWGAPSDAILTGSFGGHPVAFIPRHGRGHRLAPSELNYRANIAALKQVGVTDVLSFSAVGSLRDDLSPGTFVVIDQFVDRTVGRVRTYFGPGLVAHVSMAEPVCPRLGDALASAGKRLGLSVVRGGTYLAMEGPQFSTRAESALYRSWGMSVIGMTNMPEAKLAREAELCYATVAMVTDYDCWHPDHGHVTADQVIAVLSANALAAQSLLQAVIPQLSGSHTPCPAGCDRALDGAIVTSPGLRDSATVAQLRSIAARVL